MEDAAFVCCGEYRGDLRGSGCHPGDRDVFVFIDDVVEGDSFNELHHHERARADAGVVEDADIVDGGCTWVFESGHDARLVEETLHQRLIVLAEGEADEFDGDLAVQSSVVGAVDLPHSAFTDRHRFQFVPVVDDRLFRHHATFLHARTWGQSYTVCDKPGRFFLGERHAGMP